MYLCVGLCTGMQVPTEATRGCFISWRWSSQVAEPPVGVLETKLTYLGG